MAELRSFAEELDLDRRIRAVLAELARVSEVGAAAIGRSSPSADDDHQVPQGIRLRSPADRPPSKDRSLYDFYAWHFARARTDHQRRLFLFLAETDLEQRTHRPPEKMTALGQHKGLEVGVERDDRILSWYEGISALEVAVLESAHAGYCSEANVRKVRRDNRRDAEVGHRLEGWDGWTDEERVKAIRDRVGKSVRQIALELGTSAGSVQRYMSGDYRRKAA